MPACWSLERKHKTIKKYANHIFASCATTSNGWDKSVLRDVTAERMHGIAEDEFDTDVGLLASKPVSKKLKVELQRAFTFPGLEFKVGKDARLNECDRVSVGDAAVMLNATGGYVMGTVRQLIAMECPGRLAAPFHAALVEHWAFQSNKYGASVWRTSAAHGASLQYVALHEIVRAASAWSIRSGDRAIVLNPPGYG